MRVSFLNLLMEATKMPCWKIISLLPQLLIQGLTNNMKQFLSLLAEKKLYTMMVVLMLGAMLGLMGLSAWFNTLSGIIKQPLPHYDYIIVGGGTAGCVLAAKLSADLQHSVLLVEAGQHFSWLSSIPLATPLLQKSKHDWAYRTLPQEHSSWGLLNQSSSWPRGRGLGGSGQMNYLLHFPGHWEDFEQWEANGANGWGYCHLWPHMANLLGLCGNDVHCPNSYRQLLLAATTCPSKRSSCSKQSQEKLHVTQVDPRQSPLAQAFLKAAEVLNAEGKDVRFSPAQSTVFRGQRWSSLDAFLRPVLGRPNLHILLNTRVDKLSFSDEHRVIGVEVTGQSGRQHIRALQEVILSAGAINSPQIMLLSGIGPRQHLEQLGIPVVVDLPVGKGLKDHMNVPMYVSITAPVSVTLSKVKQLSELWRYMLQGTGRASIHPPCLLASSAIEGIGWAPPNLGLVLFGLGSADEHLLRNLANYEHKTFHALFPFSKNESQEGFVMLASCLQPRSHGSVYLQSTDPAAAPAIDPHYLSHSHDVACMANAVQLAARVVESKPFNRLGAHLHLPLLEQCSHLEPDLGDSTYVECLVRTAAITGYHPTSTCKMGHISDQNTVVDNLLRVHGVSGLRVMDASVFPGPVSGHPNSVLIAMADRASSLILSRGDSACCQH